MSAVVWIEGRQFSPDIIPLESKEMDVRARKAAKGSRRLRNAIWKLQGYKGPPKPLRQPRICPTCCSVVGAPRRLISSIQQTVAAYYGLHANAMTSSDRRRQITRARQVAMYLASELTDQPISEIGRRFNRDHTTILHAIKAVNARSEIDHQEAFDVSLLRERLAA